MDTSGRLTVTGSRSTNGAEQDSASLYVFIHSANEMWSLKAASSKRPGGVESGGEGVIVADSAHVESGCAVPRLWNDVSDGLP